MGIVTTFFVFVLVWWITLFIVLPMGVETDTSVKKGNDKGAPAKADIWHKIKTNTLLSIVITLAIWAIFAVYGEAIEAYYIQSSEF